MDIRLKSYQLLVAVAEERSFSRAAQRLHVTQPWVSTQIRQWEQEAGFVIFRRSNNPSSPVEMTDAGRRLVQQARHVVAEVDSFVGVMRSLQSGVQPLRIGTDPATVDIPERLHIVERFAARFPEITIEIQNMDDERTFDEVRRGNLDIGLIFGLAPDPQIFRSEVLRRMSLELLIPREHALAASARIDTASLRGEKLLLSSRRTHPLTAEVREFWEALGCEVIDSVEPYLLATLRIAQRHRFITPILSGFTAIDQLAPDMVRRAIEGRELGVDLRMVARRETSWTGVERFWSLACELAVP
jgi:DNA-binding transcriptional LysR family regulator